METNMAKANTYAKEKYGYSFVSLLMAKGNRNVKNILATVGASTELLTIYAIVDSVANGKEANGNV